MTSHAVLDSNNHRDLRVRIDAGADTGDGVMAALVVPNEFRQVQAYFPILFRRDGPENQFIAVALFGFETGENLYLENGEWSVRYRPWSIAIQPFLIGRPVGGEGPSQVHVDLGHPRIATDGEGVRVFDAEGMPTPFLDDMAQRLGALDEGYQASPGFYAALQDHDLLEPFTLEVTLADGSQHSLVGFHIINEDKFQALDGDVIAKLHAEGHLMPIHMALASIAQISTLVDRKNRRQSGG